jgi:hypothetical protein
VLFFKTVEEVSFMGQGYKICDMGPRGDLSIVGAVSARFPAVGWGGCSLGWRDFPSRDYIYNKIIEEYHFFWTVFKINGRD